MKVIIVLVSLLCCSVCWAEGEKRFELSQIDDIMGGFNLCYGFRIITIRDGKTGTEYIFKQEYKTNGVYETEYISKIPS